MEALRRCRHWDVLSCAPTCDQVGEVIQCVNVCKLIGLVVLIAQAHNCSYLHITTAVIRFANIGQAS